MSFSFLMQKKKRLPKGRRQTKDAILSGVDEYKSTKNSVEH